MSKGLWNFDEPPPLDDCVNTKKYDFTILDSDEEGPVDLGKKRGRPVTKSHKPKRHNAIIIISDDDDENLGLNFTGPNSQDDIFSQLTSCVGQWPKKNSRGSTKVSEVPAPIPNPVTNPDKTVEDAQAVMASFFKAADEATALQEEADNFNPADVSIPLPVSMLMMHAPACAQAAQPADSEPAPAPAAHDSEQKITLCCKYAGGEVRIKMRPSDPIRKLLVAFMKVNPSAPQDPSKYKIKFDGDNVDLDDTGASLDLEDGYTLDFVWKA